MGLLFIGHSEHTVFDLISEHALITEHPPFSFFFFFFKFKFFNFLDILSSLFISGPSHATIFGSSVLHPG